MGAGSWGLVLAHLASHNCREVRVWLRSEEQARSINATRAHPRAMAGLQLSEKVRAYSSMERFFEGGLDAVVWALPSSACREQAQAVAHRLTGEELIIHATKGVEPGTLRRISEVLGDELPTRRLGIISGPNLASEIAKGEPAATVIASSFSEVCDAGEVLFSSDRFRIYRETDVIGVEWAGVLKNILAIGVGALDALGFGWNSRAMLITLGLSEMLRFGVAMGGLQSTFLSLAGVGDLMATCSPLSRNYTVGLRVARGEPLETVLAELGHVAEGVKTTQSVWEFALENGIEMPMTRGVYRLLSGEASVPEIVHDLMTR